MCIELTLPFRVFPTKGISKNYVSDFNPQRVPAVGTYRFGVCVLLRLDFNHPVLSHVIPSFWNDLTYSGVY